MAKLDCGCDMSPGQPIGPETLARHFAHTFGSIIIWELLRVPGDNGSDKTTALSEARIAYLEALRTRFPQIPGEAAFGGWWDNQAVAEPAAAGNGEPEQVRFIRICRHLGRLMVEANAIPFADIEWLLNVTLHIEAIEPLMDLQYFAAGTHASVKAGALVLQALRDFKLVVAGVRAFGSLSPGESVDGSPR